MKEKILLSIPKELLEKIDNDPEKLGMTRTSKILFIINQYYKGEK